MSKETDNESAIDSTGHEKPPLSKERREAVGKLLYASPAIAALVFGSKNSNGQQQRPCSKVSFPTTGCP